MSDIELIPLNEGHLELARQWRSSPEINKYMYTDINPTKDEQREWFHKISESLQDKHWMIDYEGKHLGVAYLYNIEPRWSRCYWGFYLGDTSIRGQGIGSKVEYNVLQYVFSEMNFNKLLCEVFEWNDFVIKMHERFGFRRESYFRDHIKKNGEFYDIVGLAMLSSDWERLQPYMKEKIYG